MQQRKELIHFKDNIPDCQNQKYMVDSNDFCLNRNNCKVIRGYSYDKFIKHIDWQCPSKQSFKCEKYCTTNLILFVIFINLW